MTVATEERVYTCGHPIKGHKTQAELQTMRTRACPACRKQTKDSVEVALPTVTLAAPEPETVEQAAQTLTRLASEEPAIAKLLTPAPKGGAKDGRQIVGTDVAPHPWTPGAFRRQASRNRLLGVVVSLYHTAHEDNRGQLPHDPETPWVARCEAHGSLYRHKSVNGAWRMRGSPWDFCGGCKALKAGHDGYAVVAITSEGASLLGMVGEPPAAETQVQPERLLPDPEQETWQKWCAKLQPSMPAGSEIVWLGPWHYALVLSDGTSVDILPDRANPEVGIFKRRLRDGRDSYNDTLQEALNV